jgi:hypothetical protein
VGGRGLLEAEGRVGKTKATAVVKILKHTGRTRMGVIQQSRDSKQVGSDSKR